MKRLLCLFFVCLAAAFADDVVDVIVFRRQISILMLRPIKDVDTTRVVAYVIEKQGNGAPKIVQVLFTPKLVTGGLDLLNLRCTDAVGAVFDLDLDTGAPPCGIAPLSGDNSRDVAIQIPGVLFAGASKPTNLTASGSYVKPEAASLDLKVIPGERELFIGAEKAIKPVLLHDLAAHAREIQVLFRFDPNDSTPNYNLRALAVTASGIGEPLPDSLANDFIKVSLSGLLPSRPLKYRILLSIPKSLLSPELQERVGADTAELVIPATIAASTIPDRDHADFYLDLTFSSYVNPFDATKPESAANNGKRRNVGLFALSYTPTAAQWTRGLTGNGGVSWFGIQPYLKADVSTLPLAESETPTQIADGVDFAYGYNRRDNTAALRGFVLTAGARHESDRDLKFQIAAGRFTVAPVVKHLVQTRAYRDRLAANDKKTFLVTAYSFRPKIGYEIGDVIRDRPERLLDNVNFQDRISRFLIDFDMAIEFHRVVTLSASDVYYYHWSVERRPSRNYVEAKLDLNAGYLLRRFGSRGLSYGIAGKFQRGEQSPSFKPVNVFSIGVTFVH